MKALFDDAQNHLIRENIISNDYSNRWKTIIASKFLKA